MRPHARPVVAPPLLTYWQRCRWRCRRSWWSLRILAVYRTRRITVRRPERVPRTPRLGRLWRLRQMHRHVTLLARDILRENGSLFLSVLSLCLSRACLGKMFVFMHKMARKDRLRLPGAARRMCPPTRLSRSRSRPIRRMISRSQGWKCGRTVAAADRGDAALPWAPGRLPVVATPHT